MRNDAVELVPAPLLRRGVAFVIDWLLLNLINLGFTVMLNLEPEQKQELIGLSLVTSAIYHIVSLAVKSGTPGKTAMGLSVADLEGRPLRPDTAILRYLIWLVSIVTLFIGAIISLYLVSSDPRRRALHDRIAGTMVIVGRPRAVDHANRYSRF
jgi:uncharacterized RDD family membrane protein YckC